MRNNYFIKIFILMMAVLLTVPAMDAKKKLHTIGDSTMTDYATDGSTDKRGWCQMLQQFFDATNIQVNNRGKSGASSKSFYQESAYWPTLVKGGSDEMQEGDILIIQFAHNDEKDGGADGDVVLSYYNNGHQSEFSAAPDYRGTTASGTFKEQLRKYINEAKAMGVKPILVSAICRKYFKDNNGKSINAAGQHNLYQNYTICDGTTYSTGNKLTTDDHSQDYSYQMSQVAAEYDDVPYINLTAGTKELYESYGDAYCTANLFCADDATHVCALGATLIARKFATMLKSQYDSETDAKKKAVLGELAENLVLSSDISFNPTTGDMGESYVGMNATKEYNISAFGLSSETGKFTISASDGFLVSTDKSNWASSVDVDYTGYTLISTVYVKATITKAGAMTGTLTASDGATTKSLDLTVNGIDLAGGTETSCVWPLNSTSVSATSDMLTGSDATVTGMKIPGNLATPTSPADHGKMLLFTTTDGTWPAGEIDENSTRYIEFKATVPEGKEFNMDKISFDVVGWGGNSVRYHAYYATKSDFSDQVLLSENLSMTAKTAYSVSSDVVKKLAEGESIFIRVYPWLNVSTAATGKYIGLSDVTIHGVLSNAGGVDITGSILRPLVGTNDDAITYTPSELGACFANFKTEVGSAFTQEASNYTWSGTTCNGVKQSAFKNTSGASTASNPDAANTITFTYTPADGYNFVPSGISVHGAKYGTGGGVWTIVASAGETSQTLVSGAAVNRSATSVELTQFKEDIANLVATSENPLKIAISICSLGSTKAHAIDSLVIYGNMKGSADQGTRYSLTTTVSPEGAGTITVDPEMANYKEGKTVTVTATKNFGYKFLRWEEDGTEVSTKATKEFTMDKDRNLTAIFEAVPVYTVKASATNDLEKAGLGSVTVTPNEHNGQYEEGEQITATASESKILKFAGWKDEFMNHSVTTATRQVTVSQDMELKANFEVQDFVAVYDASSTQSYAYETTASYPFGADITWDDNRNATCSVVKVSDGSLVYSQSTGTPVVRNREGVVLAGINGLYQNGYRTSDIAWQYKFSTKGFTNVSFNGDMAAKNMAHKSYKAQYSLDGTTFTDIDGATWDITANVVKAVSFTLPSACDGQDNVYVRVTGTGTEQLSSSYEVEGQFGGLDYYAHSESGIGNLYILGDAEIVDDGTAPVVLSTTPVQNATGISASGTVTISYNKKIQKGNVNGTPTISQAGGGETKTVEPTFSSKSISFPYANLSYEKTYTVSIPQGYVESKAGKSAEAFELTFTIMNRVKPQARTFNAIVDASLTQLAQKDGVIAATDDMPAQYRTLQAAIDAAPSNGTTPYIIYVKNGTYRDPNFSFNDSYGTAYTDRSATATGTETERIAGGINEFDSCRIVCVNKPNINIIGQSRDGVIISTDRFDGSCSDHSRVWYHINAGATIEVQSTGTDFHMENLTVDNENWTEKKMAGPQALCFNISGDRAVMNNVRTRSYQDTYYNGGTYNRTFWNNSEIHGAVDFIYGASDVWFENCVLNINRKSGGFIVAPNHPEGTRWGYVFNNTKITTDEVSDPSTYSISLGRPWHANPKTVFLHTDMELTPVDSLWTETMGGLPALWAVYDFHDKNGYAFTGAKAVSRQYYYYTDTNGNKVWGKSKNYITDEEAASYTMANVFAGDGTTTAAGYWDPTPVVEKTSQPVVTVNGNVAEWQKDDYAICYVVQVNGKAVAFPTDCRYVGNEGDVVTVQSVNEYGALSDISDEVTLESATAVVGVEAADTKANTSDAIYTIDGKKVSNKSARGIYIQNGIKSVTK